VLRLPIIITAVVPAQNGDKTKRRKLKRRHSKTATKGMAKTATNQTGESLSPF